MWTQELFPVGMEGPMKKTRHLLMALVIAATAGILLPAYNVFTLQPAVYRLLLASTEQDTTRIAQHILSSIFPIDNKQLSEPPTSTKLEKEMSAAKDVFGLVGLKFYSAEGEILYSTDGIEINRYNRQPYFFDKLSKGRTHTKIISTLENLTDSGSEKVNVVEVSVPLMQASGFSGALEIAYNITQRKNALEELHHRSSYFLFFVGTCMLLSAAFYGIKARHSAKEQQRAELDLREAHQQLANIIDFLPDATVVVDKESRVMAWNRAMVEMTGVPKDQMIGKGDFEYAVAFYGHRRPMLLDCVSRDRKRIEPLYERMYQQGETLFAESSYARIKDGRRAELWATASPLLDQAGNYVGAIESIRDISERKLVEKRLSEKKVLLENIISNIPHHVFWKDLDSTYLGCNFNFAKVAGVASPAEIVGKTDFDLAWEQEEAEFYQKCDRDVINSGKPLFNIEEPQLQADGKKAILLTSKVPLRNANGDVVGILGIYTDITEQRSIESRLRHSQRLEAVGNLANGIAHDFNNILTAIIGYTEFTVADLPNGSQGKRSLNEVLKASNRAKDLIGQILTFGQKIEKQHTPTRVGPVIREASTLLRAALPTTIDIVEEIDEDTGPVLADSTQLHQVIMNLGTNAGHAMSQEGGELRIILQGARVSNELAATVTNLNAGDYIKLTVSDTGHGMEQETLEHIFEPYFTTKDTGEGSGLGLSVVHGIVLGHGGSITVSSTPNQGTTFQVFLPCLKAEGSKTEESPAPQIENCRSGNPIPAAATDRGLTS